MIIDWLDPVLLIEIVGALLVLIVVYGMTVGKNFVYNHRKFFFWLMVIPTVIASFYLAGSTTYENIHSQTKGPVHWHADYQVWACGERLDLVNPRFPKNKIGSPLLHEHNDDRIHIEGTVDQFSTISFSSYFSIIGGSLTSSKLSYPTEKDGLKTFTNGDSCGGEKATLKVYINGKKTESFTDYVPYPSSYVPPGDCIIVLFDSSNSPTTSHICDSWAAHNVGYDNLDRKPVTVGDRTWQ